ncbi:Phosphoinositide phosphatase family protein [Rhynchospora pubera]|uniref:Phosphoinositide phosphatase family protein n=1 Tax=Rhynchospora pubera TaxID=906938 RepID=A0AAV8D8C5_9POAL|nr:Phosphoinositide phosphatase family protein [Rhynchospora pubera]
MSEEAQPLLHGDSGNDELVRGLCCAEMELREYPGKYIVRSTDPYTVGHGFSVDRSHGVIRPLEGDLGSENPLKVSTIYGVAGVIRLLAGSYVLVITSRKEIGSYLGSTIYGVASMRFLSCNEALKELATQEKKDEAYFMSLLKIVEATPGLNFSYDRDLTINLQRSSQLAKERTHKPLWKQADPRFIWNRNLLEELIEVKLDPFIIPLIQGHFQTIQFTLKDTPVKLTLISRRCNRRLGTRMWRRGANLEGDVANFVESEQIVEYGCFRSSFLQIRGSIPLLWEQIVDLSYKPELNLIEHAESSKVTQRHFYDLMQRYGEVLAVDLTDKHGDEGKLNHAYSVEMEKFPDVRYVSFDFHNTCGKGNFDSVQLLYDQIKEDIDKQGYFLMNAEGELLMEQKGIIRSNCIDCLDRTNVTQSFLGRKLLDIQLQKMGLLSSNESITAHNNILDIFKTVWVEHGDEISQEYAGSHALKGDLVRYGRQTFSGLVKDGLSALSRYYLNNFQDGMRQDALDLISGQYNVSRGGPSPFQQNALENISYLPLASAVIIGGITLTAFSLNQAGRNMQHFPASILLAGVTVGVVALVKANGKQFCSRPRLCGLY